MFEKSGCAALSAKPLPLTAISCLPAVEPVLRELCSSFEYGHLHPDCPPDKVGRFRLDLDGAHWVGPWPRPLGHVPDRDADFPDEALDRRQAHGFSTP